MSSTTFTMELQYQGYIVTLTFNPTDTIMRFEHKETYRIYEQTFFDRDFPLASGLGGIEFVNKLVIQALDYNPTNELYVPTFKDSPNSIDFTISYTPAYFIKAIEIDFHLPAVRKETGKTDVGMLNRKLKELSESIEPRVATLQTTLDSRLKVFEDMIPLLKELQERCGDTIVLPGCDFVIPTHLISITLIRNNTATVTGEYVSSLYPNMKCAARNTQNWFIAFHQDYPFMNHQHGYNNTWTPAPGFIAHNGIKNIKNLKYLRNCTILTISGTSELTDYSPIGEMSWLTSLSIISARNATSNNGTPVYSNAGNNPTLNNISWVKNLKNLTNLNLIGCSSLSDITPLKDLPSLRTLDIRETAVRNTDFLMNPNLTITK